MKLDFSSLFSILILMAVAGLTSCSSSDASSQPVRQVIYTSAAPTPVGAYSQGILFDNTLYCAGQVGLDPATGDLVPGGITAETEQALKNLGAVLVAAGMDYEDVAMTTISLTNIDDYTTVNTIYATYFTTDPPARQVVAVDALPKNASIEISLIATKSL